MKEGEDCKILTPAFKAVGAGTLTLFEVALVGRLLGGSTREQSEVQACLSVVFVEVLMAQALGREKEHGRFSVYDSAIRLH